MIPLIAALALATRCAPAVAPETLLSLVEAESGGDPLVIGVNGAPRRTLHPASPAEAVRNARALAEAAVDFDLGLTQLNIRNLPGTGLSLETAFDPCRNLAAGARILAADYRAATRDGATAPQAALRAALSAYNTGDAAKGMRNGYVARVYKAGSRIVPALTPPSPPPPASGDRSESSQDLRAAAKPAPCLDVFANPDRPQLVWGPSQASGSAPLKGLRHPHPGAIS